MAITFGEGINDGMTTTEFTQTGKISNNDPEYCNHWNRYTQWYQLVNEWGNVSLKFPTKESNYNLGELQSLAGLTRQMHDYDKKRHDLGICRRCRGVVVRCKGCNKKILYCDAYNSGGDNYISLWCSRSCFEHNH